MIVDDELLTLEQALAMMARVWAAFERTVLEQVAVDAVDAGFNEDDVRHVIKTYERKLCEIRPGRLETARMMLEAGASRLQ
jgi:hypothetical protein